MQIRNSEKRYGLISILLHWLMAVLIIALLAVGLYMTGLENSPDKFKLYGLHKAFGMVVLGAVILRFVWRALNPKVRSVQNHKPFEKIAAKIVHIALYLAMLIMPLSGWIMSSSADYGVSFFGWFEFPHIVGKDKALHELSETIHEYAAYTLIVLILLHIAGGVKHVMIDKDSTLSRMLPVTSKGEE